MPKISSQLDNRSAEFLDNAEHLRGLVDELRQRRNIPELAEGSELYVIDDDDDDSNDELG